MVGVGRYWMNFVDVISCMWRSRHCGYIDTRICFLCVFVFAVVVVVVASGKKWRGGHVHTAQQWFILRMYLFPC